MRDHDVDERARAPFPVVPVSNMEWCPGPVTARQRQAAQRIAEETERRARRHGMTRAQFLRTAAGTATAFMVLNAVHGVPQDGEAAVLPLRREQCDDLDAARALLDSDVFVMDVQQHHVDPAYLGSPGFCFLDFRDAVRAAGIPRSEVECPEFLGRLNFVREVYLDSQTDVGVISGLPWGVPLAPEGMAATRDFVNGLAGSERALSQATCDPKAPPGSPTAIDTLARQVSEYGARALKCYTYSFDGWRLDDEDVSYPMLAEISRLGLDLVNVHKGLPAIFAPGSPQSVRTLDFPKVVRDWPDLRFCAYHAGYFQPGSHPEGLDGVEEYVRIVSAMPKRDRKRVYAEIGSSFAIALLDGPEAAAHLIGTLLATFGSRNILWGTDSVWWGSPQFLIDAFKAMQIPPAMQEQFGYPPLTEKAKARILGVNAARLYGVKIRAERCAIPPDRLQQAQAAQGGFRANRRLRAWGPTSRRQFLALLRGGGAHG